MSSTARADAAALTVRRSNRLGAAHLGAHVVVLALTGATVRWSWGRWWMVAPLIAHGVVLCALFCAAHECVHRTAFRARRANDLVASACGLVLLLPSRWFRLFHAAHHRSTHDPARDPELAGSKPTTRPGIVLHAAGLSYWRAMAGVLIALALGRVDAAFVPEGHRRRVVAQARGMLPVYALVAGASVATRSWLAVQLWLVPVLVGQPFLRAFLLAEHTGCPHVPDVLASTRTPLPPGLVRRLTWNMSFHAEHHSRPHVPFHQLAQLHRELAPRLLVVDHGYARSYAIRQRERWRAAGRSAAPAL